MKNIRLFSSIVYIRVFQHLLFYFIIVIFTCNEKFSKYDFIEYIYIALFFAIIILFGVVPYIEKKKGILNDIEEQSYKLTTLEKYIYAGCDVLIILLLILEINDQQEKEIFIVNIIVIVYLVKHIYNNFTGSSQNY
jgi:uncharacterized membrane protein YecN with MAPEG domain